MDLSTLCLYFLHVRWIGLDGAGGGTQLDARGGKPLAFDQQCRVHIRMQF